MNETSKHVFDELIEMAIRDRIMYTPLEREDRIRKGVRRFMPGALLEKLTEKKRMLLKNLKAKDIQNYRSDPLTMRGIND